METDTLNSGRGVHELALVCKQYLIETMPVILATCVFTFDNPARFRDLLWTADGPVSQIRRLSITVRITPTYVEGDTTSWACCFRELGPRCFEKLEGFTLNLISYYPVGTCLERLIYGENQAASMLMFIIDCVRQLKLKRELTSYTFRRTGDGPSIVIFEGEKFFDKVIRAICGCTDDA